MENEYEFSRGGAQAFPFPQNASIGMTLREYTAIAAMQGILANPNTSIKHDDVAHQAVLETDALLKKLKETS